MSHLVIGMRKQQTQWTYRLSVQVAGVAIDNQWGGACLAASRLSMLINQSVRQLLYAEAFQQYRALFAEMSVAARATWFVVSDETEILSFWVGRDESPEFAQERHGVKLAAMADALCEVEGPDGSSGTVDDLRRLAALHGY